MIATRNNRTLGHHVHKPTFKDIRRACEDIQATWSPRERAKRNGGPRAARWIPPTFRLSALVEAVNEERTDSPPYFGAAGNEVER